MEIITRDQAREAGRVRYFTGCACPHGHVAERFVSSRGCVPCVAQKATAWKHANPGKCAVSRRAWTKANPERHRELKRAWSKANPQGQAARSRKWFLENREKANAATAAWQQRNGGNVCAWAAKQRAAMAVRVVSWADHDCIKAIYKLATIYREFGMDVEVDHIIPMRGRHVSGLHTHDNLQVIPKAHNRAKSNHFPV